MYWKLWYFVFQGRWCIPALRFASILWPDTWTSPTPHARRLGASNGGRSSTTSTFWRQPSWTKRVNTILYWIKGLVMRYSDRGSLWLWTCISQTILRRVLTPPPLLKELPIKTCSYSFIALWCPSQIIIMRCDIKEVFKIMNFWETNIIHESDLFRRDLPLMSAIETLQCHSIQVLFVCKLDLLFNCPWYLVFWTHPQKLSPFTQPEISSSIARKFHPARKTFS